MDIKDISEIKAAIKYMDYKPALLSKFYDVKSLLFREITENPEFYKADSILPNPMNDNKIIKCMNILDKKFMGQKEVYDSVLTKNKLPEKAVGLLAGIRTKVSGASVKLSFGQELTADVYLYIPRGNSLTISNMQISDTMEFEIMNGYNSYVSEGFTLALHMEDMAVSIEPSALDGIKGQGDVFVYCMTGQAVYKDLASRYFKTDDILAFYRG